MENTCKPMAVSFQCMTKSTTNKKKQKKNFKKQNYAIIHIYLYKSLNKKQESFGILFALDREIHG